MRTNIIVNLIIPAIHNWPNASVILPEVSYLSFPHRHQFHICAKKAVSHDDRDVEIIMFKNEILDYFKRNFKVHTDGASYELGPMSCEMLCRDLMEAYDLEYVSVLEDNENGSEIWK